MPRSVRKTFKGANDGSVRAAAPGNDEALLKQAQESVRAKQEASRQNLLHLQGLEIKHLENERKFITHEKAKDVTVFNNKEIAAINQRYDRMVHRMERRNDSFMGKVARVFGGHKRQQQRIADQYGARHGRGGTDEAACAAGGAAAEVADAARCENRKGSSGSPREARRGAGKATAKPRAGV